MPFRRRVKEEEPPEEEVTSEGYIDLAKYIGKGVTRSSKNVRSEIKIAEIERYEDVRALSTYVYNGDILIIDFSAIVNDEIELRRVVHELKMLAEDVDGDIAGLGNNYIIVTPRGISISRKKYRRGSFV